MRKSLRRSYLLIASFCFTFTGCLLFLASQIIPESIEKSATLSVVVTENAVHFTTSSKHVTKSLSELGQLPELSDHILFFNRVPKSGSEMIVLLLQWMQGFNNFQHVRLKGGDKRKLSIQEQEQLVDEVTDVIRNKAVPLSFDRHVYFVNFTFFGRQSPTFINLVRDPVDKLVVSRFYFKRLNSNQQNSDLKYVPKKDFNKKYSIESLEKCIELKQEKCTFNNGIPYDLTIPYFCGQDPRCMLFNNHWALQTAKSNVDRYFPVVGVLEELNTTLEILEHKLPFFFGGIQRVYFKRLFEPHHNKNRKRPEIKQSMRDYFKNLFRCEYEFYEWIKRRLFQQLQIIYGHAH